jgi:hypothetical protein
MNTYEKTSMAAMNMYMMTIPIRGYEQCMTTIPMLLSGYELYMKTNHKLAVMRIGAFTCFVDGACTPYLIMGLALTPCLFLGLALFPLCRTWFPVCTSEIIYIKITEGISVAHLSTMTLMVP